MRLLVGLGNPGQRYQDTRHNLGWEAMERIAARFGLNRAGDRFRGRWGEGRVGDFRVFWLLPETYMNLSGESVGQAVRFYKMEPDQVVVFHDDMDLPLGKARIKLGGGNAGHNGLKSIQQHLGTAGFLRVRLGVGRPPERMDPARFVLAPFSKPERELVEPLLENIPDAVAPLLAGDLPGAMNRLFNRPEKKKDAG